ncbi:MAG: hypothetical protein ACYDDV_04550 [Methanoregula sp.]
MNIHSTELLNYLQKPRSILTLFCLLYNGNKGLDEVLEKIGGSKRTGMVRINELVKLGLVEKKTSLTDRKIFYQLSEDGQKITQEIEVLLKKWDLIKKKGG